MKLSKALKEKKRLAGDIAHLKHIIHSKNSFIEGANVAEKFVVEELYKEFLAKVELLVTLKIAINEGNKEIQGSIYLLGEYKAIIDFLGVINVAEGPVADRYKGTITNYEVQFDENKRDELKKEFQGKADRLQDAIDTYNYTTEIPFEFPEEGE